MYINGKQMTHIGQKQRVPYRTAAVPSHVASLTYPDKKRNCVSRVSCHVPVCRPGCVCCVGGGGSGPGGGSSRIIIKSRKLMNNDFFFVFLFTALKLPVIHAHIQSYLKPETQNLFWGSTAEKDPSRNTLRNDLKTSLMFLSHSNIAKTWYNNIEDFTVNVFINIINKCIKLLFNLCHMNLVKIAIVCKMSVNVSKCPLKSKVNNI